jgi:hypothetical protein
MKKNEWLRGYICALAVILKSHGWSDYTQIKDTLRCCGKHDKDFLLKEGVDQEDIDTLIEYELI